MNSAFDSGRLIAMVLRESWRQCPFPVQMALEEIEIVTPVLLESGAGALAWKKVNNSNVQMSSPAAELEQAYRLHTLQTAIHERDIKSAITRLRSAGIEPILVKGWAIARLYPESGLRPYGDLDLCVDPHQYPTARKALDGIAREEYEIDLHRGFNTLDPKPWNELFSRSRLLGLDGIKVRVPSPEDHLRILCFHFLREGAWRPLWLCDIAVALETRPPDFDWKLFVDTDDKRRTWLACAIVLAKRLLGINSHGIPKTILQTPLPSWLLPSVLKAWDVRSMFHRHRTPMKTVWHTPWEALKPKNLRYHWPNPVEATIGMEGPFNEMSRLPFQLGNCVLRSIDFLRQAVRGATGEADGGDGAEVRGSIVVS